MSHSTVVSRDSVRVILPAAALNELDVSSCDAQNAFLSAESLGKRCAAASNEFGEDKGKVCMVVRALCGLKSASAAFGSFVAKRLDEVGFASSAANPDAWMRPVAHEGGSKIWKCVLRCVDDISAIGIDP